MHPLQAEPGNGPVRPWRYTHLIGVAIVSALVATVVLIVAFLVLHNSPGFVFFNKSNCVVINEEAICFLSKSLGDTDTITVLTSFYSNIIVVIIAMLTLAAAFAAITIRVSARSHVESELPVLTEQFFEAKGGKRLLSSLSETAVAPLQTSLISLTDDTRKDREVLYALVERVSALQEFIDKKDFGVSVLMNDNGVNDSSEEEDE